MDKFLVKKTAIFTSKILFSSVLISTALSGCVTQQFENGETPVVQNQSNRNDMAATRISLGLGYLRMGNMPQAKQNLEKAKKFAPDMVQVYTAFAHYYETVGEQRLTVAAYEKALLLKSDDADTLNNYGVYLCRQGQVTEAEIQFLKAIEVPSYILVAKSYENLSSCFLQKDDFVKAEMYLNKAIMHSPSSASTLFQMVRLQYAMGDYKQAKNFEQRFEKVTRRFTSQSLALAFKVYSKLGQRRTAKNYATMLVKMYPQSWEGQQYLLNELELIDADNLAKRYQSTQVKNTPAKSKKRVVRLSPKKANIVKTEVKLETPAPAAVNKTVNKATPTVLKPALIPTASSAAINAALTTMVVEAQTNTAEQVTPIAVEAVPNKEVPPLTPVEMGNQNKSVLALSAVKTTQAETIEDESLVEVAKPESINPASIVKENTEVVKTEIPIEDTEIFHIAKKPAPIIEDVVEIPVAMKVIAKKEPKPIQEEPKTIQEEPKPIQEEPKTIQEEPKTIQEEPKLAQEKPKPIQEETKPVQKEPTPVNKEAKENTKDFTEYHVVESGDTLYNISIKYNIKMKALRRWNKLSKNKRIHIEDIIFLENPQLVNN